MPTHKPAHIPSPRLTPQLCVWRLGAPTASMFFGLRLVFSVVLSTPILGSTIIQTGVQIAGVAITAAAVTAYAFSQWWAARQQQQQGQQGQQQPCKEGRRQAAQWEQEQERLPAVPEDTALGSGQDSAGDSRV